MKVNLIATMLLVSGLFVHSLKGQTIDRSDFYAAVGSDNLDVVNAQLEEVAKSTVKNREAFEGTLMMIKAGLVFNPASKLNLFRSGHKKLDKAISKENDNAELRFLRLMIQENAPGILNYRSQIDEDSKLIMSGYKNLPAVVQKVIADYSKKSKVLKSAFS